MANVGSVRPFVQCAAPGCGRLYGGDENPRQILPCGHAVCAVCRERLLPTSGGVRFGVRCEMCGRYVPFDGRFDTQLGAEAFLQTDRRFGENVAMAMASGIVSSNGTAERSAAFKARAEKNPQLVQLLCRLKGMRDDAQMLLKRTREALDRFDTTGRVKQCGAVDAEGAVVPGVNGFYDMLSGGVSQNKAESLQRLNVESGARALELVRDALEAHKFAARVRSARECLELASLRVAAPGNADVKVVKEHAEEMLADGRRRLERPAGKVCGIFWRSMKGRTVDKLVQSIRNDFDRLPAVSVWPNARIQNVLATEQTIRATVELPFDIAAFRQCKDVVLYVHIDDAKYRVESRSSCVEGRDGACRTVEVETHMRWAGTAKEITCELVRQRGTEVLVGAGLSLPWRTA